MRFSFNCPVWYPAVGLCTDEASCSGALPEVFTRFPGCRSQRGPGRTTSGRSLRGCRIKSGSHARCRPAPRSHSHVARSKQPQDVPGHAAPRIDASEDAGTTLDRGQRRRRHGAARPPCSIVANAGAERRCPCERKRRHKRGCVPSRRSFMVSRRSSGQTSVQLRRIGRPAETALSRLESSTALGSLAQSDIGCHGQKAAGS